ncbi:Von Willebrand factor type A domain protein [hydrothermal vent metagenome]|uniref:von Willebrand factor type A domain protein n=1 Tax=hydrothermal vent metagenome TaxID=652676 RepID=A0A1W1CTR7_9ZZZZ
MKQLTIILFFIYSFVAQAENYRITKPLAWEAERTKEAIALLYGTNITIPDKRIQVIAPKLAENSGSIPISIKTTIPAKSIAVFQDANPRALTTVFSVNGNPKPYYSVRIKMYQTAYLTVVVEGLDGKLYSYTQEIDVSIGGCGGGCGSAPAPQKKSSYAVQASQKEKKRVMQKWENLPVITYTQSVAHMAPKDVRHLMGIYQVEKEKYDIFTENTFKEVSSSPLSTFSSDVDTASYANVRSYIMERKAKPSKNAVRTEEMLNYFDYAYKEPTNTDPFFINATVGNSIWNKESKILQIGLQTKTVDIDKLPASNFVFLLDVSGSMNRPESLPLLTKSLKLLTKKLRKTDRVSIVVYAGRSGVVLDRARGDEKQKIYQALDSLRASGGTAGGEGIQVAYALAEKAFIDGGNNRIILATDGDFNVGISSRDGLIKLIEAKRKSGIFLSVLGFGRGNMQDQTMEQIANHGNGNYAYIDTLLEAKKVLVKQMSGTLYTVAKDVKIQVEFNPATVHSYRLIGYENRVMANEDFNNDKKDAGEIGMGHRVTALYEIVLAKEGLENKVDTLKYQIAKPTLNSELATVKIRYKKPDGNTSILMSKVIDQNSDDINSKDYHFAQSVAGFGMLLRESEYKKDLTYDMLIKTAKSAKGEDEEGYRAEFIRMLEMVELL